MHREQTFTSQRTSAWPGKSLAAALTEAVAAEELPGLDGVVDITGGVLGRLLANELLELSSPAYLCNKHIRAK